MQIHCYVALQKNRQKHIVKNKELYLYMDYDDKDDNGDDDEENWDYLLWFNAEKNSLTYDQCIGK